MRRSVRDAIVGFTVLGGLVGFAATGMWMRGIRLGSSDWRLDGEFQ
jgi:phospholipid/cholesterol/gamma-HCH transport system substrate-binding protein